MPRRQIEIDECDECGELGVRVEVHIEEAGHAERFLCDKHRAPLQKLITNWHWIPKGQPRRKDIVKTDVSKLLKDKGQK